MILRQLFDPNSSTFTYLLADAETREAVLIDPVFEQHPRDLALLREMGLTLRFTLDTHCHADHVTGAWRMKVALGSAIGLSPDYGAEGVDVPLTDGATIRFGAHALEVRATPGHTGGCVSFVARDAKMVFTGDALLVRGAGRTDFQQGDPHALFRSIRERLLSLDDDFVVYPGHDYLGRISSTIGEERRFNPRIGGDAREEDFVGYMMNLGLPHPKQMAIAVPANLRCGSPESGAEPARPSWGPVILTYAGVPEIPAEWVAQHRREVHILDVRSEAEFVAELGHLEGSQRISLDELRARAGEVPRDKPVVVVCQTGRRSALAVQILGAAGVERTANVGGGMVGWRMLGLAIGMGA